MACLTPGVLVKLLRNMEAEEEMGIMGSAERRSTLLQIISIIPVLISEHDLWPMQGFYLKVSDSSHATYVSLPREYDEMILADKLRIGQFIYVQKLEYSLPVPILRDVNPLPGRHACVGHPKDVFVTTNSTPDPLDGLPSPRRRSLSACRIYGDDNGSKRSVLSSSRSGSTPRINCSLKDSDIGKDAFHIVAELDKNSDIGSLGEDSDSEVSKSSSKFLTRPRSTRRSWDVGTASRIKERPAAKNCYGPGRTRSADVTPTQVQCHGGKVPHCGTLSSSTTAKKKSKQSSHHQSNQIARSQGANEQMPLSHLANCQKDGVENRSCAAIRRKNAEQFPKVHLASTDQKTSALLNPTFDATNGVLALSPNHGGFIDKKGSENAVECSFLSCSLVNLGKEISRYRDSAVLTAVEALQEAAVVDQFTRCLSSYSELISKEYEPKIIVDRFLNLQEDLTHATLVAQSLLKINSVLRSSASEVLNSNLVKEAAKITLERKKWAASWIKAALASDLSTYTSMTRPPLPPTETTCGKLVTRRKPKSGTSLVAKQRKENEIDVGFAPAKDIAEWDKGSRLVASAHLTETLKKDSKKWFVDYVDKFLDEIIRKPENTETESQIAGVLCLIKKVDNWLALASRKEGLVQKQVCKSLENVEEMRAHGRLRKKIYGVLLKHVESAAMALENVGSTCAMDEELNTQAESNGFQILNSTETAA